MQASARHLLMNSQSECQQVKNDISDNKITFEAAAEKYSLCPSASNGGDLGTFPQGQMVPEFDEVVFNEELNVIHGPIKTEFGYHLLKITSRE